MRVVEQRPYYVIAKDGTRHDSMQECFRYECELDELREHEAWKKRVESGYCTFEEEQKYLDEYGW